MSEIKEVLILKYINGLSNRKIESMIGVSKSTISNYNKLFKLSKLTIEGLQSINDKELKEKLYQFSSTKVKRGTDKPHPNWNEIHNQLKKKGVTKLLLWEEYKEQYPNGYGYTQFKTYYHRFIQTVNPSMRQIHYAGDKLFVDFSGLTMPITNRVTGEIIKAEIFVSVLGASGYTFVHAVPSQSTEDFIESHTKALSFYGGVPNIVVPDNLKAGVISHKKGKIILNSSYADMAKHYGCIIEPARVYKPQDKSKVELGVKGIQRWILAKLRNRLFFDIDELNIAIGELIDSYNNRVIQRVAKSRAELFIEIDKPALHPLPINHYIYREYRELSVGIDYHIELFGHGYSVPYQYKSKKVDVWYSKSAVSIFYQTKLITTHPRVYQTYQDSTKIEHMPLKHQYQFEKWNPQRILNWANSIGESTVTLMHSIMNRRSHVVHGYKSCMAILNLSKQYGNRALEKASKKAIELNTHSVKSIEAILKLKTYKDDIQPVNNTIFNSHKNIRGSEYYQ
jgi:transposase